MVPGHDFISTEHLLHAGGSLRFFFSLLFNICIVHGFLHSSCLNTTIFRTEVGNRYFVNSVATTLTIC